MPIPHLAKSGRINEVDVPMDELRKRILISHLGKAAEQGDVVCGVHSMDSGQAMDKGNR
jgi:hypothetical protein